MDKIYDPKDIEQSLYKNWEQQGYFKPSCNISCNEKDSYCIMIAPPNITGGLHMGHAFQQTIMDTLIRYQRMQGKNVLWQPGIDHAGIATQMIVERNIANKEGKLRNDYNRDDFINKIWQWKEQSDYIITQQMRRLGNSVDWDRKRFTLDLGLSNAVKEVFIRLYQENLIYRGKRLVNWDPKLCTAISDLEIESRESKGYMWYLRYPLADGVKTIEGLNYIVVATSRPETMLGDTGVAIHPLDMRYNNLIGKYVMLPLINQRIPVIADENVKLNKGTGCVKITPAHDFNDYKIGKQHNLPMINILTNDGCIRQKAEIFNSYYKNDSTLSRDIPKIFHGLERFIARKIIVNQLNILGLLHDIKIHTLNIPYGDRSGVIIEPMLTDQWYVRTATLAKVAVQAVKNGEIKFISKQYENMYFSWMECIQDWCISRQLWWGHRIPAWYDNKGKIYVGHSEIEIRKKNKLSMNITLYQDEDVLDTWLSSGIWTFSTLGWPENTKELNIFHPTDVIVSGFDIIFFWIARMIMLTMHFIKDKDGKPQVPFKTVYITGLIRDEKGQKMSKSKGNVIDPIDMIDGISLNDLLNKRLNNTMKLKLIKEIRNNTKKQFPNGIKAHGTDALRFTLLALASTGRDINWDMKRLDGYRNFCNKLWNASRFVLKNTVNKDCGMYNRKKKISLADRWIISEFNQTVKIFREALDKYRFDIATNILYEFTWNQFCDWYLELVKYIISDGKEEEQRGTRYTLINTLESLLRLAHPVIPFITEAIWQQIKIIINNNHNTIMLQSFPIFDESKIDILATNNLIWIKKITTTVRMIRNEMNIPHNILLEVFLRNIPTNVKDLVYNNYNVITNIAKLKNITILTENTHPPLSITKLIDEAELLIPITSISDKDTLLNTLSNKITFTNIEIDRIKIKLNNKTFINRAPLDLIIRERKKLKEYQLAKVKLLEQILLVSKH